MRSAAVDDELWAAVGDPTRRKVIDLLLVGGAATATSLSEQLPVTRQAITKHLRTLDRVELVHATPVGRERRYAVDAERLASVADDLTTVASGWDARLQRIKAIAEAVEADRRNQT